MKPLVSVIIPTYNRCALLGEALDSVYAQNGVEELFGLEVVVIDDASSDATPDIVRKYPATRYFRLPTCKGPAVARNTGMAASRGVYIAFLDDDDVWLPEKLSLQVPVLEANPDACVAYSQVLVHQQDQQSIIPEMHLAQSGLVFSHLLMGNFCGNTAGFLFRRQALEAVGGFDESLAYAEDYDLWLRLAARLPFTFVPAIVASYRLSPLGHYATGIADGSRVRTMRRIIENALVLLPDDDASQATKQRARLACGMRLIANYPVYRAQLIRPLVVATLHEFPSLIYIPVGREVVARRVREFALASTAPLAAALSLCEDLTAAVAGDGGFEQRLQVRRMLGRAWAEVAVGLIKAPWPLRLATASALIYSFLHDPCAVFARLSSAWWKAMGKTQLFGSRI